MERTHEEILSRAQAILDAALNVAQHGADSYVQDVSLHTCGYAERGYTDPASGVIATGNWNRISKFNEETREFDTLDDTMPRVCDIFEKLGIEIEWSDEWATCESCSKLVRTSADSYGWKRSYHQDECLECLECVEKRAPEYLESLEGNDKSCVTLDNIDPADHGYTRVDERFENGFHEGQADNPKLIGKALRAMGITRYLFNLDSVGQFDLNFSVYIHDDEMELFDAGLFQIAQKADKVSPAEKLKSALQNAPLVSSSAPGVTVTKINLDDGTSTTKHVSPQDFIDGQALD